MTQSLLMASHRQYQTHVVPLARALRHEGLNLNEALVLLALFFEDQETVHPSSLEDLLGLGRDQISQSLKSLESNALIRRKIDSSDMRRRQLLITSYGRKKAPRLVEIFDQYERRIEVATKK